MCGCTDDKRLRFVWINLKISLRGVRCESNMLNAVWQGETVATTQRIEVLGGEV